MKYCSFFLCLLAQAQLTVSLKPETLREFESYQATVDSQLKNPSLWIDSQPEQKAKAEDGQTVTYAFTGGNGRSVTDGLVHDWVGAMYLRGQKLDKVRALLLDADRYARVYPEIRESKTLSQGPNSSVTKLRLVKRKVLTVVLDIEYGNHWTQVNANQWAMQARSRKVEEIDGGETLPADTGHGFVWRMNSQWTLRQDRSGVWVELRSVSLSRDTPPGIGWIVKPFISNFPAEEIMSTLKATQKAVQGVRSA